MSARERPLTDREKLFIREYVVDMNGAAAAVRAGYSGDGRTAAKRLLKRPSVKAAVDRAVSARATRVEVRADDVLRELLTVAMSDVGAVLDFSGTDPKLRPANEIPEAARRCIQSVKVRRELEGKGDDAREVEVTEFRLWPKVAALQELARHLGLAKPQKVEHSGPAGAPIPVEVKHTDADISAQLAKYAAEFERAAQRHAAEAVEAADGEPEQPDAPGGDPPPDSLSQRVPATDHQPGDAGAPG